MMLLLLILKDPSFFRPSSLPLHTVCQGKGKWITLTAVVSYRIRILESQSRGVVAADVVTSKGFLLSFIIHLRGVIVFIPHEL
jgi:hypothetical protein